MKISKRKLKILIETFLKEDRGESLNKKQAIEKGYLEDPTKRKIDYEKENKNLNSLLKRGKEYGDKKYLDEEKEIEMIMKEYFNVISAELNDRANNPKKYETKSFSLTKKGANNIIQIIKNTKLILVGKEGIIAKEPESDTESRMHADGAACILDHLFTEEGIESYQVQDYWEGYPVTKKSEDNLAAFKRGSFKNPAIFIVSKHNRGNTASNKDLVEHELDHIKTRLIATKNKNINYKQLKSMLRKDLQGKTTQEIVEIWQSEDEQRKKDNKSGIDAFNDSMSYQSIANFLKSAYLDVFRPDNKQPNLAADEFSVRILKLKRKGVQTAIKIINDFRNAKFIKGLTPEIKQILPYLDPTKKPEELFDDIEQLAKK